jgi:plasmid stabilization system protein ParE
MPWPANEDTGQSAPAQMTIRWTPTAARDFGDVRDRIAQDSGDAHHRYNGARYSRAHPGRHRSVEPARSSWAAAAVVTVYRVAKGAVEIHSILHSARRWPGRF